MATSVGSLSALDLVDPTQIVNVASVPKRSPFRYPGGKTWLIPQIRRWLQSLPRKPVELIEPFAGGAIVGLTAAFECLAESVKIIEKDEDVAAVWRTILHPLHGPWLAERISTFTFSEENVRLALESPRWRLSSRERAFKTILRNRVQRGGILAQGAGLMRTGENGRGMASRWYPETLKKRILEIADPRVRTKIDFVEGDGIEQIRAGAQRTDIVYFVDPPYTVAGRRLYTFSELDHEDLFRALSETSGDFLMTYDDAEPIRALAGRFGFETALIAMKSTHHAKMSELLIGRDLRWLHRPLGPWSAPASTQASLEFEPQTLFLADGKSSSQSLNRAFQSRKVRFRWCKNGISARFHESDREPDDVAI